MTPNRIPSLTAFADVPPWVSNSLDQGFLQESTNARLSCHAELPSDRSPFDVEAGRIRVLNSMSGPCVVIDFAGVAALRMQAWDGDGARGHALASLGLQRNRLYEVTCSPWCDALAREGVWRDASTLRHFACTFRLHVYEIAAEHVAWRLVDDTLAGALVRQRDGPADWR